MEPDSQAAAAAATAAALAIVDCWDSVFVLPPLWSPPATTGPKDAVDDSIDTEGLIPEVAA